jgi:hypothetical protein
MAGRPRSRLYRRLVPILAVRALGLSCPLVGLICTNFKAPYLLKIERCLMSPCWDCVNNAHCSRRGGSQPCKYYVGPALKEMPNRPRELTDRRPRTAAGDADLNRPTTQQRTSLGEMTPSVRAGRTVKMHNPALACGGPHWPRRYPHKYVVLTIDVQYIRIAWVAPTRDTAYAGKLMD